jgi:hypothetical protein
MATHRSNIDRFNLTVLQLFNTLYDKFPNPVDVDSKELGLRASPNDAGTVEALEFAIYAENAMKWLEEEGFIRYDEVSSEPLFRRVRLSLKALTVLGYTPTALSPQDKPVPLIDKVKKMLASGAEQAGSEAVKSLVVELFKLSAGQLGV